MKNIYLDTETTSLRPGEIIELSMIIEDSDTHKFLEAKNYFFKVDDVDPDAESVHGFSAKDSAELSGDRKFRDFVDEVYEDLKDACLIGHNEAFDEKFLSMELWRCGITYSPANRVCTMKYFTDITKIPNPRGYRGYKKPKLSEVLDFLNIKPSKVEEYTRELFNCDNRTFHDSRFDTTAVYVIVNVLRELQLNLPSENRAWINKFCN